VTARATIPTVLAMILSLRVVPKLANKIKPKTVTTGQIIRNSNHINANIMVRFLLNWDLFNSFRMSDWRSVIVQPMVFDLFFAVGFSPVGRG